MSSPTPKASRSWGAAARVSAFRCLEWILISSWRSNHRAARATRVWRIATSGSAKSPATSRAAHAVSNLKSLNDSRSSRRLCSAVTNTAFKVMMAVVWAFTAVSRAILTSRIASICPSATLGMTRPVPDRASLAACSASIASLLPEARRSPARGGRATSTGGWHGGGGIVPGRCFPWLLIPFAGSMVEPLAGREGQDCDGTWFDQAPMRSLPARLVAHNIAGPGDRHVNARTRGRS
jgi:hypothetical protein